MVLAKLLNVVKPKLKPGQVVPIEQLDQLLDVVTDRFKATADRLARSFATARATVDVAGYRLARSRAANPAVVADFPDVRGSIYQSELRRLPSMDREEEFRMARRHEFFQVLLRWVLTTSGVPESQIATLLKQPASRTREALEALPERRGVDRAWVLVMVGQFEELRNLYVEGALYIVLSTVNRYRGLGVDTADLIQEGNASLFQAVDGFDWRRDVRFRTYAQYWVHQAVLKMLYNSARTVRVPIWVQKVLGKIRRAQESGRREGRELTNEEIAERIGIPADKVAWVLATRRYAVSLDAELSSEDGGSLAQLLPDEHQVSVPDSVPPGDLRRVLEDVMADLPVREQGILRRRFGLDGTEPQTLGEIATDLGITAERVRQLQNAALGRIKKPGKLRQLQAFVE